MSINYIPNNCALSVNKGLFNFEAYRKGILGEILAMFVIYFASQVYQSIMVQRGTSVITQLKNLKVQRLKSFYLGTKSDGTSYFPLCTATTQLLSASSYFSIQ
jgi:hypothetical protein